MNKKYLPIILFAVIVSFAIFAFTPVDVIVIRNVRKA